MLLELLLYILKTITETKERRVFQDTEFLQPKLNQNLNQIQNQFFFILDPLCQFLREKNFFKNRVLKVFRFHIYVPSCKKLEKQNKEPLPRKTANQQADRYLSFHRTFSFGEGGGGGGNKLKLTKISFAWIIYKPFVYVFHFISKIWNVVQIMPKH